MMTYYRFLQLLIYFLNRVVTENLNKLLLFEKYRKCNTKTFGVTPLTNFNSIMIILTIQHLFQKYRAQRIEFSRGHLTTKKTTRNSTVRRKTRTKRRYRTRCKAWQAGATLRRWARRLEAHSTRWMPWNRQYTADVLDPHPSYTRWYTSSPYSDQRSRIVVYTRVPKWNISYLFYICRLLDKQLLWWGKYYKFIKVYINVCIYMRVWLKDGWL